MNKRVSIITINYNDKNGLKKTIDSVLSQKCKDFEFIIVDGDSTDGSKEYISEISKYVSKWISEPDTGIYNAMNKGIKMATGDYVYFLNSGDIFYDIDALKIAVSKMVLDVGLYYGNLIYDWPSKKVHISFPSTLSFQFFAIDNINHQACFIKRSLFEEIFYYNEDYKIISDWEFLIYAICKKEISYQHLDMLISIYDTTGISTDIKNRALIYADKEKVIQKYFPLFAFDHHEIAELRLKRVRQFFYIKKHKIAYRLLKWCMSLLLLFLPKFKFNPKY